MKRRNTSWSARQGPLKRARYQAPAVAAYRSRPAPVQRLHVEKKAFDLGNGGLGAKQTVTINTTPVINAVFVPIQGDDIVNRIGRRVTLKSFQLHGDFYVANSKSLVNSIAVPSQSISVALVWDKQPNNALAAFGDIFTTSNTPLSMLNMSNTERFTVIKRDWLTFDPMITLATPDGSWNNTIQHHEVFVKLNKEVHFNASNTGTIGDITTGALLLCFVGSNAAGANVNITGDFTCRTRFTDL